MSKQSLVCTYCGNDLVSETRDHIPPRSLFPPPRPALITVPSCAFCNSGDSKDDEYFRFVIAESAQCDGEPAIESVRSTIARSLRRRDAAGFKEAIRKSIAVSERWGPSEGSVDPTPMGTIDLPRMKRVANRVLRGLFLFHTRRRIPETHEVITFINFEHECFGAHIGHVVYHCLKDSPVHTIADGEIFNYSFAFTSHENPDTSVWGFMYYNAYPIISIVKRIQVQAGDVDRTNRGEVRLHIVPAAEAQSPRARRK